MGEAGRWARREGPATGTIVGFPGRGAAAHTPQSNDKKIMMCSMFNVHESKAMMR